MVLQALRVVVVVGDGRSMGSGGGVGGEAAGW